MKNLILFFKRWYEIIWECLLHACGSSYFHNINWLLFQWTTSLEWNTLPFLPTTGSLWSLSCVDASRSILQDMLRCFLHTAALMMTSSCCQATSSAHPKTWRTTSGPRPQIGLWRLNAPLIAVVTPLISRLVSRHAISQHSMQGSRLILYI